VVGQGGTVSFLEHDKPLLPWIVKGWRGGGVAGKAVMEEAESRAWHALWWKDRHAMQIVYNQ
jgi:hypothetical protein